MSYANTATFMVQARGQNLRMAPIAIGETEREASNKPAASLVKLDASDTSTTPDAIESILRRDGAVIVRGLISTKAAQQACPLTAYAAP
jgi:hypothetical protein